MSRCTTTLVHKTLRHFDTPSGFPQIVEDAADHPRREADSLRFRL